MRLSMNLNSVLNLKNLHKVKTKKQKQKYDKI